MARIIRCPSCGALWRLEGAAEEIISAAPAAANSPPLQRKP